MLESGTPQFDFWIGDWKVSTEDGRVLAYASTIDNRTGDPIFQTAWTHD